MSETVLSIIIMIAIFSGMAVWIPFLEWIQRGIASFNIRRHSSRLKSLQRSYAARIKSPKAQTH